MLLDPSWRISRKRSFTKRKIDKTRYHGKFIHKWHAGKSSRGNYHS
jgi:hypothetical protein